MKKLISTDLLSGDIFIHLVSLRYGVYDGHANKIYAVRPFLGAFVTDLSGWGGSIVLRYTNLPDRERTRLADDRVNLIERIQSSCDSKYAFWQTLKRWFSCSRQTGFFRFSGRQPLQYILDIYADSGYPLADDLLLSDHLDFVGYFQILGR